MRTKSATTFETLIEPQALAALLCEPEVAVIDCRFDLPRPEWGMSAYAEAHIPGALYAHLDRDLSGPITPESGRHPLPDVETLSETFSRWGIDENVQVVAYDQSNGAYASRLWWLFRWLGHSHVAVLNGGFAAWQAEGLPHSNVQPTRGRRRFTARPTQNSILSTQDVVAALGSDQMVLVDARAADRFAGKNETLDSVAGHVPGALNHPFAGNLDASGRFLSPDELRARWDQTLRGTNVENVVAMCGSGVTACHNLLALSVAGLPGARLYAGSWSEWIRDPGRPVDSE